MHLRTAAISVLTLAALAATWALAPAQARPADTDDTPWARAALSCRAQVIGVNEKDKLVLREVTNGKVDREVRSFTALPFQATALGYYRSYQKGQKTVLQLSAITSDGVPRVLSASYGKWGGGANQWSSKLVQSGFKPRLFADSTGYQAYTVNDAGVLKRWFFSKRTDGKYLFTNQVKVGAGYAGLQTLQNGGRLKVGGVEKDILYATTASGALKQISVPIKNPANEHVVTLKSTGYKGATGLSTAYCNSDATYSMIIGINATADTATWTTVRGAGHATSANTSKRGAVGADSDWVLHAVM